MRELEARLHAGNLYETMRQTGMYPGFLSATRVQRRLSSLISGSNQQPSSLWGEFSLCFGPSQLVAVRWSLNGSQELHSIGSTSESIRRFGASSWFDQAKAVPLSAQLCPSTRMAGKALRSLESTNRSTASSIQLELRRLRDRTSYQDEGMKMACSKYPFGLTQTLRLRLSMRCLG
jgi:hypothetical protein